MHETLKQPNRKLCERWPFGNHKCNNYDLRCVCVSQTTISTIDLRVSLRSHFGIRKPLQRPHRARKCNQITNAAGAVHAQRVFAMIALKCRSRRKLSETSKITPSLHKLHIRNYRRRRRRHCHLRQRHKQHEPPSTNEHGHCGFFIRSLTAALTRTHCTH